ncbi:MAG: hypothetical protein JSU01_03465 [Bacteroidetes bacterium]|nr:hypothetical protein [Bacteroidota bacterium]
MKAFALFCLLLALSCCKKFDGQDMPGPQGKKPVWASQPDTIPDNAALSLRLVEDSTDYDETLFVFDHKASVAFSNANDARYFPGFGKVSLASISSDGKDMAIYSLPYAAGMSVNLDVHGRRDDALSLQIRRKTGIPQDIPVWVKDHYTGDSLDLCKGAYSFRVVKADTNSFGSKRLRVVLGNKRSH